MARLDAQASAPAHDRTSTASGLAQSMEQAISDRIGEQRYQLWFRGHTRFRLDDDVLTVGVPNLHYQEWLSKKFTSAVNAAAETILDRRIDVRFRIVPELFRAQRAAEQAAAGEARLATNSAAPDVLPPVAAQPAPAAERPKSPPVAASLFDGIDESTSRKRKPGKRRWRHLSEFVPGAGNRVAFAAAMNAVEEPGQGPNPLVVHGPVGTGKSHLLEGIFAGLKRSDSTLRVLYVTAEDFTNRFVAAMRFGKQPAFRRHFRGCDALLLDDLHFLAKKRATQEEFLHTLDALLDDGKQIVVSCDCHPRLNDDFLPELRDRLLGGAVWGLQPPDAETRLAILRAKALGRGRETRRQGDKELEGRTLIPEEVLRFVADNLRGNVRELEGALHSLHHYSRVAQKPISLALAREVLADLLRHCVRATTLPEVDAAVRSILSLPHGALQGKERSWAISHPRMLATFLARKHTAASYAEIGKHFGGKGHSNAVAAEKRVRQWLEKNETVTAGGRQWPARDLMEAIERELHR